MCFLQKKKKKKTSVIVQMYHAHHKGQERNEDADIHTSTFS